MMELHNGDALIKFAPPAAVAAGDIASTFMGFTVNDWFYVGMVIYMVFMGITEYLDKRSARKLREDKHQFDMRIFDIANSHTDKKENNTDE